MEKSNQSGGEVHFTSTTEKAVLTYKAENRVMLGSTFQERERPTISKAKADREE